MDRNSIIGSPNPKLRRKSKKITHIDEGVKKLAQDMIAATLDWEDHRQHEFGAALAAIQVGQLYRIIVTRNNLEDKSDRSFSVLINPEIIKAQGEIVEELEGCLSIKDLYGSVPRHSKVKIKALNLEGVVVRITATGFMARVYQHEIDHLNGQLFLDHIKDPSKLYRIDQDGKLTVLPLA